MPELSIIVPVYKVEKYLNKCIDSILVQTFTDFELILIDDGSPDNCGKICDEYAEKDRRIIVIHQENAGVSAARNAGLDIAKGKYIGFVDSDDWIEPRMYELLIEQIKKGDNDIAICNLRIWDSNGNYSVIEKIDRIFNREELLETMFCVPSIIETVLWNKLYITDLLEGCRFRQDIANYEDSIFLLEYLSKCNKGKLFDADLYNVFERQDSASRKNDFETCKSIINGCSVFCEYGKSLNIENIALVYQKLLYEYSRQLRKMNQCDKRKIIRYKIKMACIIIFCYSRKYISRKKMHSYVYELK